MSYQKRAILGSLLVIITTCDSLTTAAVRGLSSKDKILVESVVTKLKDSAKGEFETNLVRDIEMRCELMFFLDGEPSESKRSLKNLENNKAVSVVVLALAHPTVDKVILATRALARIGDRDAVHNLTLTLRDNNFVPEGSEIVGAKRTLKKELVIAIEKLTGQRFGVSDYDDEKQITKVVNLTMEWLKKYGKGK